MKILLVQPKSTGFLGQVSRSGKAGFSRVTLTTIAALTPSQHEVVIHEARLSEPDYDHIVIGEGDTTTTVPRSDSPLKKPREPDGGANI